MIGIAYGQEIDFVIGKKVAIGFGVQVHTHAHYGDAFGPEPALEIDEGRHFLDAGRTPGCPEIQDQSLALKIAEINLAIGVLHGKFGSGGSDMRWTGTTVTAGE